MAKVTVYYYTKYDINKDEMVKSKRMATLEAIKGFCCIPLMETAREVDTSDLDGEGRYPIM